jgi:hypothetical protein
MSLWHYGLMAERWAECIHDTPEPPFLEKAMDVRPAQAGVTHPARPQIWEGAGQQGRIEGRRS